MTSRLLGPVQAAASFTLRFSGTHAVTLAVLFTAYATAGPVVAGMVTAARSLPSVLMPWLAGWWYDRHGPRPLLAAAGALDVIAVAAAGHLSASTWGLALLAAVLGLTAAVFDTTVTATITHAGAAPLRAAVLTGLAFDIGKMLAAGLAWAHGPQPGPVTAACIVLAAVGAAWQVRAAPARAPGRDHGPVWGSWARPLLPVLVVTAALNLGAGSLLFWQAMLSHDDPGAFAIVNVALAVGAIGGNLVLARAGLGRGSMRAGVAVSAAGLLVASLGAHSVAVLAAGSALWGLGVAWWYQALRGWVVSSAPAGYRGRAGTLLAVVSRAALMVSGPLLGLASTHASLPVLAGGVVAGCVVIALAMPQPTRWPPDLDAATAAP